jgi:hypothetical protein
MSMVRRSFLWILIGSAVGMYLCYDLADRFYFQPLQNEARQTAGLEKRLKDSKLQLKKLENKIPQKELFEQRSLPSNPEMATSLYQAWLLNLVTRLGLGNPTVDSTSPIDEGDLARLQFSIKGKASLKQLTEFLFEFYRAGNLQKINQITFSPTTKGERLDIQINIETLALKKSLNETSLSSVVGNRLVHPTIDPYRVIAQRNLFGENEAPQILSATRLTAITQNRRGQTEAWFATEGNRKSYILTEGELLDLNLLSIRFVGVDAERVILEIDGEQGRLALGKSLAEVEYLSPQDRQKPIPPILENQSGTGLAN